MNNEIIGFLKKKQEYVSGEEVSRHLNISRQALWKHIQELKDSGYDIAAVPHLGYRLISSPDRLFPSEVKYKLNTKFIGKDIYYFDTLSSTMDIALQLAVKGVQEGAVVLAEAQSKGKGRLGRSWVSPKYKGIYLSLILRPKILPNEASVLTLLSAVSICEAVKETTDLDVKIKWPNDIFIRDKKLGGILVELNAEMDQTRFIIIGIGLNVNNDKKNLLHNAASLKENKREEINRIVLLQEILRRIEANLLSFLQKGSGYIIDKWRGYNITLNRRVMLSCQKKAVEGYAVDIDADGGLLIRDDSGVVRKLMAGDVVHCR